MFPGRITPLFGAVMFGHCLTVERTPTDESNEAKCELLLLIRTRDVFFSFIYSFPPLSVEESPLISTASYWTILIKQIVSIINRKVLVVRGLQRFLSAHENKHPCMCLTQEGSGTTSPSWIISITFHMQSSNFPSNLFSTAVTWNGLNL